jgi:hypothetical protein
MVAPNRKLNPEQPHDNYLVLYPLNCAYMDSCKRACSLLIFFFIGGCVIECQ